jgi:hypothetical protein
MLVNCFFIWTLWFHLITFLGCGWPGEVLVTAECARLASPLNRGQAQVRHSGWLDLLRDSSGL